jgi:serine/threonine protein kinase
MSDLGKISYRKDKLKQHFTNTHPGVDWTTYCDTCHFVVVSRFSRKCGFCITYRFSNWQDRITHIGDHFSIDKYDMTQWQEPQEDEEEQDDRDSDDDDDQEFYDDQNSQPDGSEKDFDWHDHDHNDDTFSDSSEDGEDDLPHGLTPRQHAQPGHGEALEGSTSEGSDLSSKIRDLNHRIRAPTFDASVSTTALGKNRRTPQDSWSDRVVINSGPRGGYINHLIRPGTSRYMTTRVLGLGPYSIVDEVHDSETGRRFARKTVRYTTQRAYRALKAEVEIMKRLKHPHIVRFVGTYTTDHSLSILMTPSADCDLDYLIGSYPGPVNTNTMFQWFICLICSVDYLHTNCVKHQDIKPSNILIRGSTIFLADFGVAKSFNEFESTNSTSGNMTRKYCSPETARDGYRGRKSDIFSLGCVFLEMLSFLLHDDKTNFRHYQWKNFVGDGVFHENLPEIREWLNFLLAKVGNQSPQLSIIEVIDICRKMLEEDPRDRPSARELASKFMPGQCCLIDEPEKLSKPLRRLHDAMKMPIKSPVSFRHLDLKPDDGEDEDRIDEDLDGGNEEGDDDDDGQNNRSKSHQTPTAGFSEQPFSGRPENSSMAEEWPGWMEGGIYDAEAGSKSTEKVEAYLKYQWQLESEADDGPLNGTKSRDSRGPVDSIGLSSRISTYVGVLSALNERITLEIVVTLARQQEDQKRQTVLDWITPVDYAPQQNDFITQREAGTGKWLLDSTVYQNWLETDKQTLFLHGIPGAGKTIIASIVVEMPNAHFRIDKCLGIAYLYCNFRRKHEQMIGHLLTSLLKQLTQTGSSLPDTIKSLHDSHKDKGRLPSLDEVSRALQSVANLYSRVFIVIDALDEYPVSHSCQKTFLSELSSLPGQCGANFFATSRSIPEIMRHFEGCRSLEIRASEHDFRRYVDGQMSHLLSFVGRNLNLQEEIKTGTVEAIDGMYVALIVLIFTNTNFYLGCYLHSFT